MAKLGVKIEPTNYYRAPEDVARSFASSGIAVFPCREDEQEGLDPSTGEPVTWAEKSPYTSNGLGGATTSARIVSIWFGDRHPHALVGVPTGEKLGAWVLDIDRHGDRDGHVWLAEMEAKHGPLPKTARATTANGGTHIFFKHVDGIRNRAALAPGVDTRGQGGYIIAPGSMMADGRFYSWIDHDGEGMPEFSDAPQWLLDLVLPKVPTHAPRADYTYKPGGHEAYVEKALQTEAEIVARTGEGSRGSQLNKSSFILGTLVGAGVLSRSEAEDALFDAAVYCGVAHEDGERQTRSRIKRGLDDGAKSPRQIPERHYAANDNPVSDKDRKFFDTLKSKVRGGQEEEEEARSEEVKSATRPRFELTWFDDIEEGAPKEMFVKGAFGVREFTTVSGLPGTGKSVIVTDIACHVAAGRDWHGKKVKQGLVVYVAAERKKLTERRMMAFRKRHGVKDVPLLVLGGRLDFTKDTRDAKDLIAAIKEAEIATDQECVWVIIDTLTRVFGGGDQNASKDMTRFVQSCDEILAETNAHVTAIHHSAWSGERGKGAIDLDGAVDASFMVKKTGAKYQLICDGTNDGEEGTVLTFAMDSVEIGVDEDGEPTTAPVVVPSGSDDVGNALVESKTHKDKALQLLIEMMQDGEPTPGTHGFPETGNVVSEEAWRQAFYDSMEGATQATKQATFKRAERKLKEREVGSVGQFAWVK